MTRRVGGGGTMDYQFDESNISIEHIQRGINLPDWLFNYNLKLLNWGNLEEIPTPRIMIIYANEESRKQALKELKEKFEKKGMLFSGLSPDNNLPEIIELKNHPWFIGVQFHPEFKSRPLDPHPLFSSFISAAKKNNEKSNN